ncbi:MAG: HD domain-containing protein [Burkholderiales bacterium]|nr:MAG: HD domain-containing protein [Burkholderiales bacterium]
MPFPARRTAPDPIEPASESPARMQSVRVGDDGERRGAAAAVDPASVRGALVLALAGLLALAIGIGLFTRHNLVYRIHDYAILNLAGQLRELSNGMGLDARQIVRTDEAAPGPAELERYREKLGQQVAQYDRIVQSFVTRELSPDLTGLDDPVSCTWDALSLRQLAATAAAWQEIRVGVLPGTLEGASATQIVASARTLATDDGRLLQSSRALSIAFKEMMQRKLDFVIRAQVGSVILSALFGLLAFVLVRRHVLRPLAGVEHLARRVIAGDLGSQAPVAGGREIAAIGVALNRLSRRMHLLFGLAERSAGGLTTGELLDTLRADLSPHVPIDFVAVAFADAADLRGWRVLRTSGAGPAELADGTSLGVHGPVADASRELAARGRRAGFGSLMTTALRIDGDDSAVLLFAARVSDAFPEETAALLRNVARHVQSQLERTLSTEALVVAAVEGLAKLAESRDPETGDHLLRMSLYSALVAAELGRGGRHAGRIDVRFVEDVRRFAPMHDIGKVGISDAILLKPGRLTDAERADMCRHPTIGADVLRRCEAQMQQRGRSMFRIGIEIAEAHHERWDGTGYPNGLAGEAIPLSARIVAVADVFDALTSRRPYKEAWSIDRALATIDADSGSHFDPEVVAALHRTLPEVLAIHERHKHV